MILTALVAAAMISSPIEDFSALVQGAKLTYQDANGLQVTDEIGGSVDIGKGLTATSKVSSVGGQNSSTELYRVDGDTLYLVGYIDKKAKPPKPSIVLLPSPQPIFRANGQKADWFYTGEVATGLGPVLQQLKGDSRPGPKRKVLDREVETLDVHITSKIGNDKAGIEVRQDVIYAKGIGMIEMSEATKAQGRTVKKVLKLVKFEPPQG
jgi:hypothetical protein